jgi:hypothetical protein
MHSVLFVATNPNRRTDWDDFVGRAEAKLTPDGNEKRYEGSFVRLAENVWLLDVTMSAEPLGWLTSQAQVKGIPYGLLVFDKEPYWLPSDFQPQQWK